MVFLSKGMSVKEYNLKLQIKIYENMVHVLENSKDFSKKNFNEIPMRQKNKIYIFNAQGQQIGSDKHSGTSKPAL